MGANEVTCNVCTAKWDSCVRVKNAFKKAVLCYGIHDWRKCLNCLKLMFLQLDLRRYLFKNVIFMKGD